MMAAISAAQCGRQVVLLEAGSRLGRKILVSGDGRCNLTNVDADSARHYHGGRPPLARHVLRQFSVAATLALFRSLGVETQEESRGRLFPRSGQARSIVAVLADRLAVSGVRTVLEARVHRVRSLAGAFELDSSAGTWHGRRVVFATGGPSAPQLGADRSGIDLLGQLEHRVTELLPGLVPLVSPDPWVRRTQGARVHATVSVERDGACPVADSGELLFTSYGISGLAVLNLSLLLVPLLRGSPREVVVDLFPGSSCEELSESLKRRWQDNPHRTLAASFLGLLADRVAAARIGSLGLSPSAPVRDLTKQERWRLAAGLHAWRIPVTGPRSWEQAEVTIGGIQTREVHPETLESHRVPGLYLAGEMLDVHGDLGGYNLQWAWSSGWVAGRAAAS